MATPAPFDTLISYLARPLLPADRAAFTAAAQSALVGCDGEGHAHRILRPIWRSYFHPPPDPRVGAPRGPSNRRPSKLLAAEPIDSDAAV
jgi:hypothetical protein